jgi:hypothetical protein
MHLLTVDIFPPTPRDPFGIHKAIWDEIVEEPFVFPRLFPPLPLLSFSFATLRLGVRSPSWPSMDVLFYAKLPSLKEIVVSRGSW